MHLFVLIEFRRRERERCKLGSCGFFFACMWMKALEKKMDMWGSHTGELRVGRTSHSDTMHMNSIEAGFGREKNL